MYKFEGNAESWKRSETCGTHDIWIRPCTER